MSMDIDEYFHDFRQNLLSGAEAREDFLEAEFTLATTKELEDSGMVEGFEPCQYKAPRGMRVDGYWYNDDGISLDLYITDFTNREKLEPLTRTDAETIFKRVENFFTASAEKSLYNELEETSLGYGLARDIAARASSYTRINFYLLSERKLSDKVDSVEEKKYGQWAFNYNIWDISRLHRISASKNVKEELTINFTSMFGSAIQCLPAHVDSNEYESFLMVLPGKILSELYGKYGDRLLEQNVRCFLQARGKVNKGIRATILTDPGMFFAYNNGITATAREVTFDKRAEGLFISEIRDLQIVNGGQTTASLFHTSRKDKASLDKIFVQMKLSVVDSEKGEEVIPRISEYANTQNKVNAADFFSNHPFHVRMEEFSRRIWAPAIRGATRETKWFYERARGQYADAQAKITRSEQKKFLADFPKPQMFSKTDLAKFENVWDEKPTHVNYGAQKNFAQYAKRIGQEWEKSSDIFNEFYYKRLIARAIIFRRTEKIVSAQSWYNGGYRANIVAYTLALLGYYCKQRDQSIDFLKIWDKQSLPDEVEAAIVSASKLVHKDIISPPGGISNVTEWCKKDGCWMRIQEKVDILDGQLSAAFKDSLVSTKLLLEEKGAARQVQKIDNGIEAQKKVLDIPGHSWRSLMDKGRQQGILTPKEASILEIASQIPRRIPTEKQSIVLLEYLEKAYQEGIMVNN